MSSPVDNNSQNNSAKELLLADYLSLSDSLWKNELSGETRVNWFIGLATAAAGGLIGLTSAEHRPHGEPLRLIYVTTLFALFAFGFVTLFRIIKRNETTDGLKRDSKAIRQMFKEYFDSDDILDDYYPFAAVSEKKLTRKLGGLAHIVLTINSLLFAGIVASTVYPFGAASRAAFDARIGWTYPAAIAAFGIAWFGQFVYVQKRDAAARKDLRPRTGAGGIVYRMTGAVAEYLLVGPKEEVPGAPKQWLFPKGRHKKGEELWETAVREVGEETGIVGRPIALVGQSQFRVKKENVVADFYLMESFSTVVPKEKRRLDWYEYQKALKLLTHSGNQRLLLKAELKRLETS